MKKKNWGRARPNARGAKNMGLPKHRRSRKAPAGGVRRRRG